MREKTNYKMWTDDYGYNYKVSTLSLSDIIHVARRVITGRIRRQNAKQWLETFRGEAIRRQKLEEYEHATS
jgi:hypothetical protein